MPAELAPAEPRISDEAAQAGTGKTWEAWFTLLDQRGGRELGHKELVALAGQLADLSPWWRQMVAVAYEQSRGLREKYESADGYQISRSKTLSVAVDRLYAAFADEDQRRRWLPQEGITIRKATLDKSLRMNWSDGKTVLDVDFYSKGANKCQVVVQHRKLAGPGEAERMKAAWGQSLAQLKAHLEG